MLLIGTVLSPRFFTRFISVRQPDDDQPRTSPIQECSLASCAMVPRHRFANVISWPSGSLGFGTCQRDAWVLHGLLWIWLVRWSADHRRATCKRRSPSREARKVRCVRPLVVFGDCCSGLKLSRINAGRTVKVTGRVPLRDSGISRLITGASPFQSEPPNLARIQFRTSATLVAHAEQNFGKI